jgi:hypothetical protein
MGTTHDQMTREQDRREDDKETKDKLKEACKVISKQHYSVNSDAVEGHVKPTSLVLAQVCHCLTPHCFHIPPEHILRSPFPFRVQYIWHSHSQHPAQGRDWRLEISIHPTSLACRGY